MARLQALPPQVSPLQLPITQWYKRTVEVPKRFCRPPPKAYTDLQAKLTGLTVGISAGLEPAAAALTRASRRLVPPSFVQADATLPPTDPTQPLLQWWDRMRYQWRGRLRVVASDAAAVVATSHAPAPAAHHTRMHVQVKHVEADMEPDGMLRALGSGIAADALVPQHDGASAPGEPLLRVPLALLPALRVRCHVAVQLPGGRHAGDHHVFVPAPADSNMPGNMCTRASGWVQDEAGAMVQGPVDVVGAMAAEGFSIDLEVTIGASDQVSLRCTLVHPVLSDPCCALLIVSASVLPLPFHPPPLCMQLWRVQMLHFTSA